MASLELSHLWKLAQIDNSIADIKKRAASLDVGQEAHALILKLEEEDKAFGGRVRELQGEITDTDLQNKGIDEKIKKINAEIYSGKVGGAREIELFEREISQLKKQKDKSEFRVLQIMEELPGLQKSAATQASKIATAKAELAEKRKSALVKKAEMEADYAKLVKARPAAEALISKTLLARYDGIRKRSHGVAMVGIYKGTQCAGCGTNLPTRTIEYLKDDKLVTCEACHRILYHTTGVI